MKDATVKNTGKVDIASLETKLNNRWYLLTAKPNQDRRAEENLINQSYTVYRPLARVPRVRRGKRSYHIESMFPRYLFIQLNQQRDNWAPIRSTYGVSGFVKFGLYPSVVPDELIFYLQDHEKDYEKRAVAISDIQENDAVLVMKGAFKGCEGIFQKPEGAERAMVLLHFLGFQRPVVLPTAVLRVI